MEAPPPLRLLIAVLSAVVMAPTVDLGNGAFAAGRANGDISSRAARFGWKLPPRMPRSNGPSLFVSLGGSDAHRCTLRKPCRTVGRAFAHARSGTTIYVRGGTYREAVELRNRQFDPGNPVTIRSYPGERALFTGSQSPDRYGYFAFYVYNVQGLRVRGFELSDPNGNGLGVRDASDIELDHLFVHDNAVQGIIVGGVTYGTSRTYSQNIQLLNSFFTANGGKFPGNEPYAIKGDHSIYWGDAPNQGDGRQHGTLGGVIANNVIYDQPTGRGIQIGHEAWDTIVTNNTVYRTYSPQPDAGQPVLIWNNGPEDFPTRGIVVVNNIVASGSGPGIAGSGSAAMPTNYVDHNLSYGNAKGDFVSSNPYRQLVFYTLGSHNITGHDPRFVDPSNHDFHLRAGSPAIGAGDSGFMLPTDINGTRRLRPTLGAYAR